MRKWDDDNRMKSYKTKILNAKSTMPTNQKKIFKKKINRDTEFSSHASYRSDFTDIKESILYKYNTQQHRQLLEYSLQQYAKNLLLQGYGNGLQQLASQTTEAQNTILQDLKLVPGHKQKFIALFKYLNEHYDPHNYNNNQILTPNNVRQNRNIMPVQINSHGKFEYQREVPFEILKQVNRRASMKHFSPNQDFGIIKPKILPKLKNLPHKSSIDRSPLIDETYTKQFDIYQDTIHGSQLSITKETITKPLSKTANIPIVKVKQTKKRKSQIKHNNGNKLLKKLLHITSKNTDDINLQQDQIQLTYQSFDNGKLASTLINIDIEELSYCVGITLQKMIQLADLEQLIYFENEINEIQQAIFKDDNEQIEEYQNEERENYYQKNDQKLIDQTFEMSKMDDTLCQQYLREAIIEPEITDLYYGNEELINEIPRQDQTEQSDFEIEQDQIQQQNLDQDEDQEQEQEIEQEQENNLQISKSYFSCDTTYNLEEYMLYYKVFIDKQLSNYIPNVDIIQNYCKNIMTTTKMEREVAIISMIYINRLLKYNSKLEINCLNWQKILFTSLVLASKIWDDESFENNNFAKVLPQFSTVQINEMEKVFLKLIQYNLYVKSGEYAKQYLILRTYADKKQRSYALKQLDISTVIKLQRGGQQSISKQQYQNTQNKSF